MLGAVALSVVALSATRTAAAPTPAPASNPTKSPPPVAKALADALRAEAGGKAVALVARADGLVAMAPGGSWTKTLFAGPVASAVLDDGLELVWFLSRGSLYVLDLRATEAKPVVIATGLTEDIPFSVLRTRKTAGDGGLASTAGRDFAWTVLTWSAKPALGRESLDGEEGAPPGAKLVGAAWLRAELGREAKRRPAGKPHPALPAVALPEGIGECEDPELCGSALPFGPTGHQLVVVTHSCGDFCYVQCLLYDPAKRLFGVPPVPATWSAAPEEFGSCEGYFFELAGPRFLFGTSACEPKTGCQDLGGTALGWLDGSHRVGL